jgi:SAM-dependent methyltransferase
VRRLLPSGIMPHGPKGAALLERWDKPYRGKRVPPWDTGRVANELKKAVEDGTIRPGRALVLGCGSGTNAIYLAGKGFDVTGLDVAPTALVDEIRHARRHGEGVGGVVGAAGEEGGGEVAGSGLRAQGFAKPQAANN